MADNIANIFPISVCGYKLKSVENKLVDIINDVKSLENHDGGETGSFSLTQNILEKDLYADVKQEILECVYEYKNSLHHPMQDIKIVSSWSNTLSKDQYIQPHSHSNSYICGVIHLSTGGDLLFRKPDIVDLFGIVSEYDFHDDLLFRIPATPGQLVLFPSKTTHSVVPHNNEQNRYSIAFNTWPMKYGVKTGYVDLTNA